MASSPVNFLLALLLVCIVGWIIFMFTARLVALLLSRVVGASVAFRISGCNCLRDVTVKFKKGAVESVSVGEIKLSLRKSLVKLGFGFISKDPKLQLVICDLEIVIRNSEKKTKKSKSQKPRSASRGKWMILANMARFLSVSVTDLVVKTPKAVFEVKNMGLDLFKNGGSNPILNVKLHVYPFFLHLGDPGINFEQSNCLPGIQGCPLNAEKNLAPFVCDDLSVDCEFGHDREVGIGIRNLDVSSGDITVILSEDLTKRKSDVSVTADPSEGATLEHATPKKSNSLLSMKKNILLFPDKVTFDMPKLDLRYVHQGQDFTVENNVMGVYLKSSKSLIYEDSGEATSHFDVQVDFSEIHLIKDGSQSILEILKVAAITSIDVPIQAANPIRAEIDVKLGGAQCNLILSRLMPLLHLQQSKKKKMVLPEQDGTARKSSVVESKPVMWTCTLSAPETTIVLYDVNDQPLYHGCSQSSHLFANNIASKGMHVHAELGELYLQTADEHQECSRENLFGVETSSGCLVHIARVSIDRGHKETESHDQNKGQIVFSVDITGMGVYLNFQQVECLITNAMALKAFLRKLHVDRSGMNNKGRHQRKKTSKGEQVFKLNLEQCSVSFAGEVGVEDAVVLDPKRVNYGSQGGETIISVSADGTSRQAFITSTISSGSKFLRNSTVLDLSHLSVCINKDKQSTRVELERARSVYKEYSEELGPITKVTLFDIQNAKFVRRLGGLNETSVCSLFSATDISARWEPDAHLAIYETVLRLKFLLHNLKLKRSDNETVEALNKKGTEQRNDSLMDASPLDKHQKKKDSVIAVDIEMLRVSAELADGVEALVQVQSIFSENAKIGILLEGLILSFNEARIFKSSRMQISRLPVFSSNNVFDTKSLVTTKWDWVIQGLDVRIFVPYRLQLRAIEDAVEDTLRALKLVTTAKTNLLFPVQKDRAKKSKSKSSKLRSVKFNIHRLTADIEEEPIQGWVDEHYRLMKNEVCELATRLKFLDDTISKVSKHSGTEQNDTILEKKIRHNGVDIDINDESAVERLREEIHKNAFRSYYLACQRLTHSEGTGACINGFQGGFRPSTSRTSLLSLCATELDVTLNKFEAGDSGMIEFVKKQDPVALENDIPFSRLYGRHLVLHTGSLVAQLRDYTFPLFAGTGGKCEGHIVLAQQATCFQPQMKQHVYVGRWRKVCLLRSASGFTPPMKMYSDLSIHFEKGEICFGVGFEPAFADISYAFTVALRRANLSVRNPITPAETQPPKKERSLPWWDDARNYIHGKISLYFAETRWNMLGTTNPYEKLESFQIVSGHMNIQQSDGRVSVSAKEFKNFISSLESMMKNCSLKVPTLVSGPFLVSPSFLLEVVMDWECESGNPLNHYLYALPNEGQPQEKVLDPFRSTSLSLRWNFSLRPCLVSSDKEGVSLGMQHYGTLRQQECNPSDIPTVNVGPHDLAWLFKCWNLFYLPPHKLRSFSRWPRFGIPRVTRSGNLSLDKVMTEFFLRLDATPACIKHVTLGDDDPATGLTFKMTKLKYELCFSRGKQKYTFDCKREPLDLVYQGLDLHLLKAYSSGDATAVRKDSRASRKNSQTSDRVGEERNYHMDGFNNKHQDEGFLLSSDYFTIRKQAPKADPARLLAWQDGGRKNLEMTYVRSEFENGSESDRTRSDPSDDDGFNVVIADNCQRVFIYGLKLLWTIENRDAVWSWVGGISKAFEPPKPSPSRQYAQRKLIEEKQNIDASENLQNDSSKTLPSAEEAPSSTLDHVDPPDSEPCGSPSVKAESSASGLNNKHPVVDDEEDGTRHFMVNVIQPQFNLHSEDANGRFLLAAASGRVLARSFHSVLHVGYDMIEKALGTENVKVPESEPEVTWKRVEFSVMLEHVQAHVAPTDVDPGAGLQWLNKIPRSSPKVKRNGALLERVFMPCQMYFRYTRHKGGLADLKVKPLKELSFNSPNITATMTSRQFQVMLDVLSNLLFARLPKPRKNSLAYPLDDQDVEEEIDEVVPDGVEEVELARINLEKKERERKLLLDDIRFILASGSNTVHCSSMEKDSDFWMITGTKSILVQGLKKELGNIQKSRKTAAIDLRMALQKAAQTRLMEKEKNKSPSYAMRISMRINKVVWSMLTDGKAFAEAEINNMIYDFDRDYKDIGVAQFTTKSFEVRNCLSGAKSNMLLSPWNAPPEWGKNFMLRVDAKQGAPKDGTSPLDLFQVDIYPLKIYLTETMYRMMWEYFFPEEEQDSHRRQEVWKVSTTAGTRRGRKSASAAEAPSSLHSVKDSEAPARVSATTLISGVGQSSTHVDASQIPKLQYVKPNPGSDSNSELRRTSSFDRTWEEGVTESTANEIIFHVPSSSSKSGPISSMHEPSHVPNHEVPRSKSKDNKLKSARLSHEDKKVSKSADEKRARARKMMEFHNIKISQVELLVTYEGSRFAVNDLRLLMDTFHHVEFTGTWRRLFSRVKKHIIWGVLKSVTGMQGKKFKDKSQNHREANGAAVPDIDLVFSDSDGGQPGKSEFPISWLKRPNDGAGDGFVTSIKGLFNSQRRKAKAFVMRTMRGEPDNEAHAEWSESDAEAPTFARQLTITKRILRRHKKKTRPRGQKTLGMSSQNRESLPCSPREMSPIPSESSGESSQDEDFHE